MKKITKLFAPALIITGSVFFLNSLIAAKPEPEKKPQKQRLISLYVDKVTSKNVTLTVPSHGEVTPKNEIDLNALVSGKIVSISKKFSEGAKFNHNDLLIKIDDSDYQVAVIRAQAQVSTAQLNVEKELANSKIKKEQWRRKNNKAKPSDYALNIPQIAEAQSLLRAAQADLKAAKLNLSRTEIRAPFTGRVLNENIGTGQYITPATNLGHIFSTQTLEVRMPLTDSQLTELNIPVGFVATANNAPSVVFSAVLGNKTHQWQGKIVRTNAAIDKDTRLIYAIAEITDPYDANDKEVSIAVGMYVSALIDSKNSQETLVVPRNALQGNDKVYVINPESKLEIRKVAVLSTNKDFVHITEGLSHGEKVVTSTLANAIDGMLVKALTREDESISELLETKTDNIDTDSVSNSKG